MSSNPDSPTPLIPLPLTDEVKAWLRSPVIINHFGGGLPWAGRDGIQKDDWVASGNKQHRRNGRGAKYQVHDDI